MFGYSLTLGQFLVKRPFNLTLQINHFITVKLDNGNLLGKRY